MRTYHSLIIGVCLAHALLGISFSWQPFEFWLLFPISLTILIAYALTFGHIQWRAYRFVVLGIMSGTFLYGVFAFGKYLIVWFSLPLLQPLQTLYLLVQPLTPWHHLLLFMIIIPGEEVFWRGFVLTKLLNHWSPFTATLLASSLYASAHIYSSSLLLVVAAVVAGVFWSLLYIWKRSIWLCIISHLIFDMLLLWLFPLL